MENKNRYEGIRTVHPNRLTPKGIAILTVIGILLLALALYFLPWPTHLVYQMTGAEVDNQGNVIATGDFVLEAWHYNYLFQDDKFTVEHLEMPNIDIRYVLDYQQAPDIWEDPWGTDLLYTVSGFMIGAPDSNGFTKDVRFCSVYMAPDFSYFLIEVINGSRIFIGSSHNTLNYTEILEQCHLLED